VRGLRTCGYADSELSICNGSWELCWRPWQTATVGSPTRSADTSLIHANIYNPVSLSVCCTLVCLLCLLLGTGRAGRPVGLVAEQMLTLVIILCGRQRDRTIMPASGLSALNHQPPLWPTPTNRSKYSQSFGITIVPNQLSRLDAGAGCRGVVVVVVVVVRDGERGATNDA